MYCKIKELCVNLVIYKSYTKMHGQQNFKQLNYCLCLPVYLTTGTSLSLPSYQKDRYKYSLCYRKTSELPEIDILQILVFYILLTVHLSTTLANNQIYTQFPYSIIRLLQSSTCFEQRCAHHHEVNCINPYPTAFPYGNGMVLHFYQQQESSTTKTVHRIINKGLKTYV